MTLAVDLLSRFWKKKQSTSRIPDEMNVLLHSHSHLCGTGTLQCAHSCAVFRNILPDYLSVVPYFGSKHRQPDLRLLKLGVYVRPAVTSACQWPQRLSPQTMAARTNLLFYRATIIQQSVARLCAIRDLISHPMDHFLWASPISSEELAVNRHEWYPGTVTILCFFFIKKAAIRI